MPARPAHLLARGALALALFLAGCAPIPATPPVEGVVVEADGLTHTLPSSPTTPAALLDAAGILLNPGDELWADGRQVAREAALPRPPARLTVRRAVEVVIAEAGAAEAAALQTAARTVAEALWQAGYRLTGADRVEPPLAAPITPGLRIVLHRARAVTIQADGQTVTGWTQADTVEAALAEAGVPLVGLDYATPAAEGPVPADGVIRVVRVREALLTEQTLIPRETVYQALPEVDLDTVQALAAGADGILRRYVRVRHEDGVEVSRAVEREVTAQAPSPQVIGYGAKITVRTLQTPEGTVEYWRAYTVYATSYSASRAGVPRTARNYGLTASGKRLTIGMAAVDRRYIPFGTRMYVPGYGVAVAEDTGGGVKGRFIDLGFDDWNYVSWHQVVTVYFLTPIPPAGQIAWIIPSTVP